MFSLFFNFRKQRCLSIVAAEGLFGFIASSVDKFVSSANGELGFTFSFPVNQFSISEGTLIEWTKGFVTSGVKGENIVGLLRKSFKSQGVNLRVVALCNDTVGTLITECAFVSNAILIFNFGHCKKQILCVPGTLETRKQLWVLFWEQVQMLATGKRCAHCKC